MKRLIKKANNLDALNSIIRDLQSNDKNGTYDEIYDEMMQEYNDETIAFENTIEILIESLMNLLNDLDSEDDKDSYDFYTEQLNKIKNI